MAHTTTTTTIRNTTTTLCLFALAALTFAVSLTEAFCPSSSSSSCFYRPQRTTTPTTMKASETKQQHTPTQTHKLPTTASLGGLLATCAMLLAGGPNLAGAAVSPAPTTTTTLAAGNSNGVAVLNDFLRSVKSVKDELKSDQATDLSRVQKAFDVEAVTTAVDGTLDAQMSAAQMDQTSIVGKRKVVDKVLRQVLSDVIVVEDTLRDLDPARVGEKRMKKVNKPLTKLESDLTRLTAALTTTDGDTADAVGLGKPLFSLCPDGYLLCNPE